MRRIVEGSVDTNRCRQPGNHKHFVRGVAVSQRAKPVIVDREQRYRATVGPKPAAVHHILLESDTQRVFKSPHCRSALLHVNDRHPNNPTDCILERRVCGDDETDIVWPAPKHRSLPLDWHRQQTG